MRNESETLALDYEKLKALAIEKFVPTGHVVERSEHSSSAIDVRKGLAIVTVGFKYNAIDVEGKTNTKHPLIYLAVAAGTGLGILSGGGFLVLFILNLVFLGIVHLAANVTKSELVKEVKELVSSNS